MGSLKFDNLFCNIYINIIQRQKFLFKIQGYIIDRYEKQCLLVKTNNTNSRKRKVAIDYIPQNLHNCTDTCQDVKIEGELEKTPNLVRKYQAIENLHRSINKMW